MNIQAKKSELVELVLKTDEIKILERVGNIRKRKAVITKQNSLFYRIDDQNEQIILLPCQL